MRISISLFCAAVSAAVFCSSVSTAAEPARIDAGTVTGTFRAGETPIKIEADQATLRDLATQAFSTHGAFRLAKDGAQTLRFNVTGANSVQVSVGSFTQNVTGSSLRNALLRAADAAVTHLTRKPGYFAGKLAFVSERTGASEIYTSDLFFGEMLQMTSDRSQAMLPKWAPDGRRILYTGYWRNGFPDIYVLDTANNERKIFVSIKGTNTGARFSPDGQRVAMILSGEGNPEVYLTNAAGKITARLTRTERQIEATPSWSRDGSRLVVASDGVATGKPQLYFLGTTPGSALQRIATNISNYCAEPDWSHANPDMIAFTAASGRGYQVAVYSIGQGTARFVTKSTGDAIEPCWLSDGRHLLYTSRSAGASRICIVDTETGRMTAISPSGLGKAYQASFFAR